MKREELLEQLGKPFPEEAISVDTGRGFSLTGIKAPYIVERLNDVLGPCGLGWTFEVASLEEKGDYIVAKVFLKYQLDGEWSQPIEAYGDNQVIRERIGDTTKAAVSDAIKKAASYIGVGLDAYKGLLGPSDAGIKPSRKPHRESRPPQRESQTSGVTSQGGDYNWFWSTVLKQISREQVHQRLGVESVNDWLKAEPGRTLREAAKRVLYGDESDESDQIGFGDEEVEEIEEER